MRKREIPRNPSGKPTVPVKPRLDKDYSSVPLSLDQLGPHIMAAKTSNQLQLEFEVMHIFLNSSDLYVLSIYICSNFPFIEMYLHIIHL